MRDRLSLMRSSSLSLGDMIISYIVKYLHRYASIDHGQCQGPRREFVYIGGPGGDGPLVASPDEAAGVWNHGIPGRIGSLPNVDIVQRLCLCLVMQPLNGPNCP